MKYCLFDFFEEGTVEIGLTNLIDLEVDREVKEEHFSNDLWNFDREVLVNWQTPSTSTSKKQTKKAYVARIKYFSDDRLDEELLRLRNAMVEDDESARTSVQNRGTKRPQKRPLRFESSEDDEAEDATPVSTKRKKTNKTNAARDALLLEKLAKKKETASKSSDKERLRDMQDQLSSVTKERDSLLAVLACVKELPHLLQKIKEASQTVSRSSSSSSPSSSSPSSSCLSPSLSSSTSPPRTVPISPKYGKKLLTSSSQPASKYLMDLMTRTFTREVMASHSLTGGASNANGGKEARPQIDRQKMDEIFKKVTTQYPEAQMKNLREAARNKLSNERKLLKKQTK